MHKKFLQTLLTEVAVCSVAIFVASYCYGSAPGADEWKDGAGRRAPEAVLKAGESLWSAVRKEGDAAWACRFSVAEPEPCRVHHVACHTVLFLTGISIICPPIWMDPCFPYINRSHPVYDIAHDYSFKIWGERALDRKPLQLATKQYNKARQNLHDVICANVTRADRYAAQFIPFRESWVKDGRNEECLDNCLHSRPVRLFSVTRDVSEILPSILAFVNEHGGWSTNVKSGYVQGFSQNSLIKSESLVAQQAYPKLQHADHQADETVRLMGGTNSQFENKQGGGDFGGDNLEIQANLTRKTAAEAEAAELQVALLKAQLAALKVNQAGEQKPPT